MALQKFVCGLTVMTILFCGGYHAEPPACYRPVISSRIIGGENAVPGRWPWYAAIRYNGRDICGGSLINEQWVLTSAFCTFREYVSGAVVHFDVHNRSEIHHHEESRGVEGIFCHPEFNTWTLDNDICLLKLSAPVSFTDHIRPVCLASESSTLHDGVTSWVTGFGTGSFDYDTDEPDILQETRVPIVGNNRCNCSFHNSFSVTDNMMCAGFEDGRNATDWDDTGVPLVTKQDSVWVQTGIQNLLSVDFISSGFSVFTRVSQYEKWIKEKVSGKEPGFVTFTSPGIDSDLSYTCP